MKKCPKCDLIFQLEERSRCLYCDTLLMALAPSEEPEEFEIFKESASGKAFTRKQAAVAHMIKDHRIKGHGRMQYIVGCYFRTRTFHFMYNFSRSELRIGEGFSRLLVQPLNFSHFLVMPWVLIDLVDSVLVRMIYRNYCPECGWKYKAAGGLKHDPKECEYCKEYSLIVNDIFTGHITLSERIFKKRAFDKIASGETSPYQDLCSEKRLTSILMDVISIWFSVSIILSVFVFLIWPFVKALFHGLDVPDLHLR